MVSTSFYKQLGLAPPNLSLSEFPAPANLLKKPWQPINHILVLLVHVRSIKFRHRQQ